MYINGISGYLSKFEGIEVDAAVERVQGLDEEFALKVDKTTTINGYSLANDIILTSADVGALADSVKYGASLKWENNIIYLLDQDGVVLNSQYIETEKAKWGNIYGSLTDQVDLKEALDSKPNLVGNNNFNGINSFNSLNVVSAGTLRVDGTATFTGATLLGSQATATTQAASDSSDLVATTKFVKDQGYVPNTIQINGYSLTGNVNLTYNDVGALPDTTTIYDLTTEVQQQAINSGINGTLTSQITVNQEDIASINSKIPTQASASNQLADKDFVNSSVSTNTAYFDGAWDTYEAIPTAEEGFVNAGFPVPTNNNYLVVREDETQDGGTWRYKYTTTGDVYSKNNWKVEYQINEAPFPQAWLDALNSNITADLTAQIIINKNDITAINGTLSSFGNIVTHDVAEFATAAQGAKADTALQSINSAMIIAALGYTPIQHALVITDYTV